MRMIERIVRTMARASGDEANWRAWWPDAIDVLWEIREPTTEMCGAAQPVFVQGGVIPIASLWGLMVDAACKEPAPEE